MRTWQTSRKLRDKHNQLCRIPSTSSSSNRLRDSISQADTKGLALFVHECLECHCRAVPRFQITILPAFC